MQDILFKTCISGYVDLTRTYPAITFPDNCEWQLFQFTDFPQIMKTSINSSEIPILYCPDIFYLRYETYEPGNYSGTGSVNIIGCLSPLYLSANGLNTVSA